MSGSDFKRVAVIMAGGAGERFWPLSRQDHPKQLLHLGDPERSMLQEAIDRLSPMVAHADIYVATAQHLQPAIRAADTGLPAENILGEPCKRNTAGCLIFAAAQLLARGEDPAKTSMAVVTADHLIGDAALFRVTVDTALEAAEKHEMLVTHGIVPTQPETGYGYIQARETAALIHEAKGVKVYEVSGFHEKPNAEDAALYLERGDYYWNAGMFFWRLDTFLTELNLAQSEMAKLTYQMADALRDEDEGTARALFERLENLSIDYALMEKSPNVALARAEYPWDDVGSWSSLDRTRERDSDGNVAKGNPVLVDCKNCIVYNEVGAEAIDVSVVGAEDLVVVVSKDGILITPKDRAQDVRNAVVELKQRGSEHV